MLFDAFISGFEFGLIAFVSLQLLAYLWNRSTPQKSVIESEKVKPIIVTITADYPMEKAFKLLEKNVKEQSPVMAEAKNEVSKTVAKAFTMPRTSMILDVIDTREAMETLKKQAKELKIKNVHNYKSVESLRRAIEKAKQA